MENPVRITRPRSTGAHPKKDVEPLALRRSSCSRARRHQFDGSGRGGYYSTVTPAESNGCVRMGPGADRKVSRAAAFVLHPRGSRAGLRRGAPPAERQYSPGHGILPAVRPSPDCPPAPRVAASASFALPRRGLEPADDSVHRGRVGATVLLHRARRCGRALRHERGRAGLKPVFPRRDPVPRQGPRRRGRAGTDCRRPIRARTGLRPKGPKILLAIPIIISRGWQRFENEDRNGALRAPPPRVLLRLGSERGRDGQVPHPRGGEREGR